MLKPEVELQAGAARAALASNRGSSVDALAAQSAISELDDRIFEAESEAAAARAELARWIGDDAQRELADMPAFDELPADPERLHALLHRHASLLTIDAQLALARSEIDLARAAKRPDWSAELAYADRGNAFSDMVSLEFRIELPLFGRYRQDPAIRAKRAELARMQAQRQAELRMHSAEVSRTLALWDALRKRIDLYEHQRLPLARQRSRAALSGFQSGILALDDVLASHVAEIELQQEYAELTSELGQAWTFLRYLEAGKESS
jgi:outer membrane protein TolC